MHIPNELEIKELNEEELAALLVYLNDSYRNGNPLITDELYDHVYRKELEKRFPDNSFLKEVEPESIVPTGEVVDLPELMLSTDKAYTENDVTVWINRGLKVLTGKELPVKITPKLDGFASCKKVNRMFTRGNGKRGTDISHVLKRGLKSVGVTKDGPGEIVINVDYFNKHLSNKFKNTRNALASVIKVGQLSPSIQKAIDDGAIVFMTFASLPTIVVPENQVAQNIHKCFNELTKSVPYNTDGIVLEFITKQVKEALGHNNQFHKWQIAFKINKEAVLTTVTGIKDQVSRTGTICPVVCFEPITLSGVMVSQATGHNYAMLVAQGIGVGAVIRVVRAGDVIPKIISVVTPGVVQQPTLCPSCTHELTMGKVHLRCNNTKCPDQKVFTMLHFFKTLDVSDGFGEATVREFVERTETLYTLLLDHEESKFRYMGFGAVEAANLNREFTKILTGGVEDYKLLAALGIEGLGRTNSKLLLKHYGSIYKVCYGPWSIDELTSIKGIGPQTASSIRSGFMAKNSLEWLLHEVKIKVINTNPIEPTTGVLAGKVIVFTGTMPLPRSEMARRAKELGAVVEERITKNTNLVVVGFDAGSKLDQAKSRGIEIMQTQVFMGLLDIAKL